MVVRMSNKLTCPPLLTTYMLIMIVSLGWTCEAANLQNEDCIACHGRKDLTSRKGKSRFIDPERVLASVHWRRGIGCVSCHEGIFLESGASKIPHGRGVDPKCRACHERVSNEYEKSLHFHVSKNICYSCHNPHYTISFRDMSKDQRKDICLRCHDANRTHRWLPQKELHFSYLECTSCHSVNAQIGVAIFMVNKGETYRDQVLTYKQLEPFLDSPKNLIETLDKDSNWLLSETEISDFIERVRNNGIADATLEVRILVRSPNHNFSSRGERTQDCTLCHSRDARFYSKILLEVPEPEGGFRTIPMDRGILLSRGRLPLTGDFYLLGESKIRKEDLEDLWEVARRIGFRWLDLLGAGIILTALCAVCCHGLLMFITRKSRKNSANFDYRGRLPIPVLAWHWFHGLCMTLLVTTGIQLRLPDMLPIFAKFLNAVNLHNLIGTILIVDYIFWVSFHLWKKEFKSRFFVSPKDFFQHMTDMLHYYGYLIFIGERVPERCSHYSPFDPLERAFFLTTMFVLLPIQSFSGILLLYMNSLMPLIKALGGLRIVDAIHIICGYLLIAFLIIHVYFHTLKKYGLPSTRN